MVYCSKLICGKYITVASCAHKVIGICVIYVTFEGHFCYWHLYGSSMIMKSCIFRTAESIQLCYTSHFVVVGSSSVGVDVVNKFVLMIVVVACVVSKSPDALVEVVIFLDFDFMYVYLFPTLECTI